MRVELGGSDWADLMEPGELRQADRRAVLKHSMMEVDPEAGKATVRGDQDDVLREALLKRIMTNWSFPMPLPQQDPQSFGKLTLAQADALAEAVRPHMALIMGRIDPTEKGSDPTTASSS